MYQFCYVFYLSSRRRHTRCALVTGVQTCALPICLGISSTDWVKNGDRWTVTAVNTSGAIRARHLRSGLYITLPATYVSEHVELGYATTVHRSEEHTSELQSLMRISYAVFCLKKKIHKYQNDYNASISRPL